MSSSISHFRGDEGQNNKEDDSFKELH